MIVSTSILAQPDQESESVAQLDILGMQQVLSKVIPQMKPHVVKREVPDVDDYVFHWSGSSDVLVMPLKLGILG